MASVWGELRRRNVFKVAVAYAIVGWLLVEVASVVLPTFNAPQWIMQAFTFLVIVGFPLALILAWAYELTPEGMKKEKEVDRSQSTTRQTGRRLDFIIIGVMAVAIAYFLVDKFLWVDEKPATTVAVSEERPSVAMLPFANRSANVDDAFFVDGIHDDLLSRVSKIASIKTISRTSVLQYRDTTKTIPQIAEELGVATVLEGGVQRAGEQVRINVQLIDARTDEPLWSEIYDRQLSAANIFSIQSEIATAIAEALRAALSPEEQYRLKVVPTENLAALEAYFLGKQALARRTGAALADAVDYFKKAIELDPGFALAYVGQADSYVLQVDNGNLNPKNALALAAPLIDKALELDDQSGEAYATLALSLAYLNDHDATNAAYQRALEIDPNYVSTHHWYSNFLRDSGLYDAGMKQIEDAIRLDPLSAVLHVNLGTVLYELGRPEESLAQFKKTIEMDVEFPLPYWCIGGIYWTHFGQLDTALIWFKQALERNPGHARITALIGLLYLDLGGEAEAEHWINTSLELQSDGIFSNWAKEMLLLSQGESTQAANYAGKVLQQKPDWAISLANLRNQDLRASLGTNASARYKKQFPMLFDEDEPKIDRFNVDAAINLGLVMTDIGQLARAQLLLDRSLDYAESTSMPRLHWYPVAYGIPQQVQIYALQGKTEKALEALRKAVDHGWRGLWWYWLEHDPNLDSIRDDPEFQAMVVEIKADMVAQLVRVRAMEASGEL